MAKEYSATMTNFNSALGSLKWGIVFIVALLAFFSINPFVNISAGHRGIVFDKVRGGVQMETMREGLHFRIPFLQSVVQIPIRTQKVVFSNDYSKYDNRRSSMKAASSDLQDVNVDVIVTYHLESNSVAKVYQEVGSDYESKKVVPRAVDAIKTFTAKYKVAEILTKREEIRDKVFRYLEKELLNNHIVLEDVNLTNFDFNDQFKAAIEQKQIEEQKAQKEEYILKQKEIRVQQIIKEAEADKQAKILEGEGIAEYNKLIQMEITDKVLEYKRLENAKKAIEKWNGLYPATYFGSSENSAIPLINLQP